MSTRRKVQRKRGESGRHQQPKSLLERLIVENHRKHDVEHRTQMITDCLTFAAMACIGDVAKENWDQACQERWEFAQSRLDYLQAMLLQAEATSSTAPSPNQTSP